MRQISIAFVFLVFAGAVHAETVCVGDVDALNARLTSLASNGQDDVIQIIAGNYEGGFIFNSFEGMDITLSGGWNVGCTIQTPDPRITVLDGFNTERVLRVIQGATAGSTTLENLSFMNGFASGMGVGNNRGAGVNVASQVGYTGDVTIRHCIFANNVAEEFGGAFSGGSDGGTVLISNSLFFQNTAAQHGALSLTSNGSLAYLVNNTIADNHATTMTDPVGGIRLGGTATWHLNNNILWFNDMTDVFIQGTVIMNYNNFGTLMGTPGPGGNNISSDPLMSAEDDYALFINSPSINAGTNTPPGGLPASDLFGFDRIFGVVVDQGVHEVVDILFKDGLEN